MFRNEVYNFPHKTFLHQMLNLNLCKPLPELQHYGIWRDDSGGRNQRAPHRAGASFPLFLLAEGSPSSVCSSLRLSSGEPDKHRCRANRGSFFFLLILDQHSLALLANLPNSFEKGKKLGWEVGKW